MSFDQWLSELDRIFMREFGIDHVLAGFSEDEMKDDWTRGEAPDVWVQRIGTKYALQPVSESGLHGWV